MKWFSLARPLLYAMQPETAHDAAIWALEHNMLPAHSAMESAALEQTLWGLSFPNPVGLGAGFDKNARAFPALSKQGFGFVEVGTLTPRPQAGNPKPRLFRLEQDSAIINRFGFNNEGVDSALPRLQRTHHGVLGVNIGKNKDTEDPVSDYVEMMQKVWDVADYITVNISSPNTQGLRDLQAKEPLAELLSAITQQKHALQTNKTVPVLLKIAPDLNEAQQEAIAETVLQYAMDGLIVSNTTIARPDLASPHKAEVGGLSGAPLFDHSTQVLRNMYRLTKGTLPIIGVGGISNGEQAYAKIKAGASLVQVYSALIYQGFDLVREINQTLLEALERDGLTHIGEAIALDHA